LNYIGKKKTKFYNMKLKEPFDKYTFDEIIKRLLKLEKDKKQRK